MHELLPLIHPANQRHVNWYLDCYSMRHIEAMLRSTKDVGVDKQSPQLKQLALFYADMQETALKTNLEEISYIISSPADANLVAGASRVEAVSILLLASIVFIS
jgi:predicted metal-dependent HD superfamily phosphohydrolase